MGNPVLEIPFLEIAINYMIKKGSHENISGYNAVFGD
jgi:hypothetical protein